MESKLAICIASDKNYLKYVEPLLVDLKAHTPVLPKIFLLFDGFLDDAKNVLAVANNLEIDFEIVMIESLLEKYNLNTIRHITRTTFARIFAADIIPLSFSRILYLDIDILVIRDISPLFDIEPELGLAAVPEFFDSSIKLFKSPDVSYFNAGVLLINADHWRENKTVEKCLLLIEEQGNFNCQDQDVLNLVFKNNWQLLPPTSNVMVSFVDSLSSFPQLSQPMIVHFVGRHKAWHGFSWTKWHKMWIQRHSEYVQIRDISASDYIKRFTLQFYRLVLVRKLVSVLRINKIKPLKEKFFLD